MFGRRRRSRSCAASAGARRNLGERLAVGHGLSGSAADIVEVAMIRAEKELAAQALPARLVLQFHDGLIFEAPQDEVQAVLPLVRSAISDA